jgi:hypothetical protein
MSGNNKKRCNKKPKVEEILPVNDEGYDTPTDQPITVSPYITWAPVRPKYSSSNITITLPKIKNP